MFVKQKKLSLIELMVCLVIISLVGVVLFKNVGKSLDEGKAFRSLEGARQIYYTLNMESVSNGVPARLSSENWEDVVLSSAFFSGGNSALYDGWGNKFVVSYENDKFMVRSSRYEEFLAKKGCVYDKYWE